jgi:hypothetical protein
MNLTITQRNNHQSVNSFEVIGFEEGTVFKLSTMTIDNQKKRSRERAPGQFLNHFLP